MPVETPIPPPLLGTRADASANSSSCFQMN
jgi:hypothetical protein